MRHIFNEDEFDVDGGIKVTSTSNKTATTSPIELCDTTDTKRLVFEPIIVDNVKDPESKVKGTLVYERKKKSDEEFPSQIEDSGYIRGSITMGDYLTFNLSAGETRRLYEGLRDRYEVASVMDAIPRGTETYRKIDPSENQLLELVGKVRITANTEIDDNIIQAIAELLKLVSKGYGVRDANRVLEKLNSGELQELTTSMNLTRLERAQDEILSGLTQTNENYWQQFFQTNQWILSQVFVTPFTVLTDQVYLGGKSISNRGGAVCDFAYRNNVTNNIALIEIKTPATKLLSQTPYRHGGNTNAVYSLSTELTGAINQALDYRETLIRESQALKYASHEQFEVFSPKCILIIGDTRNLDKDGMLATFERFRNSLENIEIVAFNELLAKIDDLISLFKIDINAREPVAFSSGDVSFCGYGSFENPDTKNCQEVQTAYDDDIPF